MAKRFVLIAVVAFCLFAQLGLCSALQYETEPNDDLEHADILVSGEPMAGQVATDLDEDWFSIEVHGPDVIQITFEKTTSFDWYFSITVQDGLGNPLAIYNDLDQLINNFGVGVTSAGTYYIVVEKYQSLLTQPYQLTATISPQLMLHPDFDSNFLTDLTIWRPITGGWYGRDNESSAIFTTIWGIYDDIPVTGDFDGDQQTDAGVWRPSTGCWYVLLSSRAFSSTDALRIYFGLDGDIPVPGDYNGDGITDIGVWRPSNGYWYINDVNNNSIAQLQWGTYGDVPVPGDYNGDSVTEFGVWKPYDGRWSIRDLNGLINIEVSWGAEGDVPVPADFNGDGATDLGLWRPSSGTWYVSDIVRRPIVQLQYGIDGDIPLAGDYDGDLKADITIFRPITGQWFIRTSSSDYSSGAVDYWGIYGDLPLGCSPFAAVQMYLLDLGYY